MCAVNVWTVLTPRRFLQEIIIMRVQSLCLFFRRFQWVVKALNHMNKLEGESNRKQWRRWEEKDSENIKEHFANSENGQLGDSMWGLEAWPDLLGKDSSRKPVVYGSLLCAAIGVNSSMLSMFFPTHPHNTHALYIHGNRGSDTLNNQSKRLWLKKWNSSQVQFNTTSVVLFFTLQHAAFVTPGKFQSQYPQGV